MPCDSGMDSASLAMSYAEEAKKKADEATRLLCEVLKVVKRDDLTPELRSWKEKHDAQDKRKASGFKTDEATRADAAVQVADIFEYVVERFDSFETRKEVYDVREACEEVLRILGTL